MTLSQGFHRFAACFIACCAMLWAIPVTSAKQNELGKQLYASRCASCHGGAGQGSDEYSQQLAGELSPLQLAEQIRVTMPADDPESLTIEQAQAVARYIHGEFYSSIAQARSKAPTIDLARLTAEQHRRVLSDLVGSFRPATQWKEPGGLWGVYFNGHQPKGNKQAVLERKDPTIEFDYGVELPVPECENPQEYSMRWSGSVHAEKTGWYEFQVTTNQAFRLKVNSNDEQTIDAWVKSGDDTEFKAKVYLLGGRAYPITLEFSRGNKGVQEKRLKDKFQKTTPASIRLGWTPPQGTLQTIPARQLSPKWAPTSYVCTTAFPPDDRSYGWVRGTSTSPEWFDAVTAAAIETTAYVVEHLEELAATKPSDENYSDKLREFCTQFVSRALRRELDQPLRQLFIDRHFEGADDPEQATRKVLLMTLTSPRFLFREASGGGEPEDTAARLAFALADSLPDASLRKAAAEGKLTTDDQRRHAERLLADIRTQWKLRQFLFTWLGVDAKVDLHKDTKRFPDFGPEIVGDLRTSLELAIHEVLTSDSSDYRTLFLDDHVFLNQRLAEFYEVKATDAGFTKVKLDAGRRAGMLTHPYLMSHLAHTNATSPIHRGVFLVRGVLGQPLKPPPEAVAPLPVELHPDLTTRERVTLQTKDSSCMICHHAINPLGFALEQFDAVGRWRDTELDKPIDTAAVYQPSDAPRVEFDGARDMAEYLATSNEASEAFVQQMFHFLVGQSLAAYGPETAAQLHQAFVDNDYSIRQLAVEIAVVAARTPR